MQKTRCSVPIPGVEVMTEPLRTGGCETTIHGGRLDGERFKGTDLDDQHERACRLVRMAAWERRGRGWRR